MTINLHDIIIDRSAKDKAALISRRQSELRPLGYSVVNSEWLASLMANANWNGGSNGKTQAPRSYRSQEAHSSKGHSKNKGPHPARA